MNLHALETWLVSTAFGELRMVLIASSLLCVASWLLCSLLGRRSAAVRFGVWQLALCGILASTLLIVLMDGVPLGLVNATGQAEMPVADAGSSHFKPAPAQSTDMPSASFAQSTLPEARLAELTSTTASRANISLIAIAAATWLAFAGVMLVRLAGSAVRAQWIVRRAESVTSPQMLRALEQARIRIGLSGNCDVQLRQTAELSVPFTLGILRSTVVIPKSASEWSAAKLEMVLAHELAHVLRRDVPGHWISRLSCCVAGLNPLTWLAQRQCVFERERACDDRVLQAGYSAADYGQSLLEVAAAMRGRKQLLVLGVSMAYPHFRRRLETILTKKIDRRPLSRIWIGALLALFAMLTLAAGALRPFDARLAAAESPAIAAVEPMKSTPTPEAASGKGLGRGTLSDFEGRPIVGASVEIQLEELEDESSPSGKMVRSWKVMTDKRGAYQFDSGPVDTLPRYAQVRIQVAADGYVKSDVPWSLNSAEASTGEWNIPTRLWKAKSISGRIVDSQDRPVAAILYLSGNNGDANNTWSNSVEVAADGRFEIAVPQQFDLELLVFADSYAPTRVAIDPSTLALGDIHIAKGTRISGQLLDRVGQPVEGVVIGMLSHDDSKLPGIAFSAQSATVTDAEGRFALPASSGKCQVWATASAYSMDTGEKQITGVAPPPVTPIEVDLGNNPAVTEVQVLLQESDTITISGNGRWENGDPAANLEVKVQVLAAALATVKTDAHGQYQFRLPRGLPSACLMAIGMRDSAGVWLMAHGQVNGVPSSHPQIIEFENLSAEISHVDWILKPRKK